MPTPVPGGEDKDEHSHVGAAIRLGTEALGGPDTPRWMSWGAPALAGVAKELYDRHYPQQHTPDAMDAAATALGALLMFHSGTADHDFTMVPTISPERMAVDLRWRF